MLNQYINEYEFNKINIINKNHKINRMREINNKISEINENENEKILLINIPNN